MLVYFVYEGQTNKLEIHRNAQLNGFGSHTFLKAALTEKHACPIPAALYFSVKLPSFLLFLFIIMRGVDGTF